MRNQWAFSTLQWWVVEAVCELHHIRGDVGIARWCDYATKLRREVLNRPISYESPWVWYAENAWKNRFLPTMRLLDVCCAKRQ